MLFSQTLATLQATGTGYLAEVGEDWLQGRAVYGGMVAALGNEAMRRTVPAPRLLRGLEIVFAAPLLPGPVQIDIQEVRVGKAVTVAVARIGNGARTAAMLTGIYGAARSAELRLEPELPAGVAHWSEVAEPAMPPGLPTCMQHFALKFAQGAAPFAAVALRGSKIYAHHRDPAPLSESHLVALIDCIPPPLLQMMATPAPSSSLTWTLDFIRHDYHFPSDAWWRIDTEVDSAGDGYSRESSLILDPQGRPAAFSRQLVAVFG